MGKLFGTDGVRGVYGTELTDEIALKLGYYGTKVLSEGGKKPKIVIGMDTRESGVPLEKALCDGISAADGDVMLAGVIPTPAVAVLTRVLGADAGIVISASHNPYEYNGIKFFSSEGYKLPDAVEDEIEAHISADHDDIVPKDNHVHRIEDPAGIYAKSVLSGDHADLSGMKIIIDCANGASVMTAPAYFEASGADLTVIGDKPDGRNINLGCGSTHLDKLAEAVVKEGADIGIAFDGDADRCLAVDEKGGEIDGDMIINLLAGALKEQGELVQDTAVVTVMSNLGLHKALAAKGIKSVQTAVGDRYVLEEMLDKGYILGGEQSGHIIMLKRNTTGDGLLTASLLTDMLGRSDKSASELASEMTVYPQVLVNAQVPNSKKYSYTDDDVIMDKISRIEDHFEGSGRVLIRPSGTEPLVRVMIEGEDQSELEAIAGDLGSLIEERLAD